jgi:CRP-like cAMP-binding protein
MFHFGYNRNVQQEVGSLEAAGAASVGFKPVLRSNGLTKDDLNVIQASDFFHSLEACGLNSLVGACRVGEADRGEVVFYQADPADCFFVVLGGLVKVVKLTERGDVTLRRIVGPGGTLAEAASFADGCYPGTAEAIMPSRVLAVPVQPLIDALGGSQSLAFTLVLGMARQAEKSALAVELAYRCSVPQRLALFLCALLPKAGCCAEADLPYEKVLLAQALGTTPESLSRAFAKLRAIGVQTHRRGVWVEDVSVLRTFCGLNEN